MGEFNSNEDTGTTEASEKSKRISYLQSIINETNFNLQEFNEERQSFNFQIKLDALNSLFFEIISDLTLKEEEKCSIYMKGLEKFLDKNQIIKIKQDPRVGVKTYTRDPDPFIYKVLKNQLSEYELLIKRLLGIHNFSGPRSNKGKEY